MRFVSNGFLGSVTPTWIVRVTVCGDGVLRTSGVTVCEETGSGFTRGTLAELSDDAVVNICWGLVSTGVVTRCTWAPTVDFAWLTLVADADETRAVAILFTADSCPLRMINCAWLLEGKLAAPCEATTRFVTSGELPVCWLCDILVVVMLDDVILGDVTSVCRLLPDALAVAAVATLADTTPADATVLTAGAEVVAELDDLASSELVTTPAALYWTMGCRVDGVIMEPGAALMTTFKCCVMVGGATGFVAPGIVPVDCWGQEKTKGRPPREPCLMTADTGTLTPRMTVAIEAGVLDNVDMGILPVGRAGRPGTRVVPGGSTTGWPTVVGRLTALTDFVFFVALPGVLGVAGLVTLLLGFFAASPAVPELPPAVADRLRFSAFGFFRRLSTSPMSK